MFLFKKGVHPVVSVALLLVVSVVAVISLQTWYGSYQSDLFSDLNSQSSIDSFSVGVEDIIGEELYFNGGESGITITRIEIDGVECSLGPGTYTNLAPINVSDCLELSSSSSVKDVLLITESDVLVKQVFVPLSPSSLTESNPITTIESNNNFNLLSNGVVDCSLASVGDRATLNGKNYTAVSNQNLSDMIESNNVSFNEEACTSLVTDMNVANSFTGGVFYNANINPNISHWDTSSVTDMSEMFSRASNFNQPLNFDTSLVTNMSGMFAGATSFNTSLNFDTSSVVDMSFMFFNATNFNSSLNFDTSSVANMPGLFLYASSFNQPLNFDTSSVTDMSAMFVGASSFNQPLNFNTSSVVDMSFMFFNTTNFNSSLNFSDTSSVIDMSNMFFAATVFDQPLTFNTSSVINMSELFLFASSFNQPLNFDTSSVLDMGGMFYNALSFDQDLSGWCVPLIGSKPTGFDGNTPTWNKTNRQPVWNTCP